ncbi:non-ribosomal peptide synthetase [Hyalangium minutum]|uniref:Long-chain-fatty-acid--CoA ligase n=1 Tax=Hyalangium minutum TaxID=394096 RepID=A0A085WWD5_9BACT|nr:non-ribosomal peptide synthetase [Hyalangium minutum]KFE71998.1 Long-chain-fatty-acid--CoA ligase [Hyalangium minutum]
MSEFEGSLGQLINSGVELWVDGGRLGFKKVSGKLSDGERSFLSTNKARILELLGDRHAAWLSGVQKRIWFISQYAPESTAYTIPFLFDVPAGTDPHRLQQAFEALASRHLALRASFPSLEGIPIQMFEARINIPVETVLLPHEPRAREDMVRTHLVRPFRMDKAPLFKVFLFRAPDGSQQLGLSLHHLIGDGWSIRQMMRDLGLLYAGEELPGTAPSIVSFLRAERLRNPETLAEELRYWRQRLANPPVLSLPYDQERPRHLTYDGGQVRADLDEAISEGLRRFARENSTSVFTVLLAAFGVFLHQHSRQRDLMAGIPYAARETREAQDIVGCLMTTLVLRLETDPGMSFVQLISQVGRTLREALGHASLSFDRIVESLALERDTSRNPVFQVLFGQIPAADVEERGLPLRQRYLDAKKCQFDLEYYYSGGDGQGAITSFFVYNTRLFEEETVRLFSERWLQLVPWLIAHPSLPLRDAPRLAPSTVQRIRNEWNATAQQWDEAGGADALIARQAQRSPDKIAVVSGPHSRTYGELLRNAGSFAARLCEAGVRPGSLVGIKMERSVGMVEAILGSLLAGAGFVPLDPAFPSNRLGYMIEASGTRHVVTDTGEVEVPGGAVRVVYDGIPQTEPFPPHPNRGEDVAYVMFTSGSTGQPKGVAVRHHNLVNLLRAMARAPGMQHSDRLLAVTSLSFDISLLELLLPLTVGATVRVATREEQSDAQALLSYLEADGITVMQGTPSTWRMLLQYGWTGSPGLKVLCGGEALSDELARVLMPKSAALWNLYGPTETTIWSSRRYFGNGQQRVTLGQPIENTRLYVLDEDQRPVPLGVEGELYIAGDGVAQGYIGREDLTAQRFPTLGIDELGVTQERCYRTGDRVRQRHDGELLFLGRQDHQVKVRGHRIEPGEVEARLAEVPGIAEAVVAVQGEAERSRLVAFLVSSGEPVPTGTVLAHLRKHLPSYMIPHIEHLERMPMTLNGKVDRTALAQRSSAGTAPTGPQEALSTGDEIRVAAWFSEVLEVPATHRQAEFFELGGQSLLATRVLYRINQHYNIDMRLPEFFQGSTVAVLAARIKELVDERQQKITAEVEGMSEDQVTQELKRLGLL